MLAVTTNRHLEFHELSDVAHLVVGSVSIVYRNRYCHLPGIKPVLHHVGAIDHTTGATAVEECSCHQGLGPSTGVQDDINLEVVLCALVSVNVARQFTEFVESLSG